MARLSGYIRKIVLIVLRKVKIANRHSCANDGIESLLMDWSNYIFNMGLHVIILKL